MTIPANYQEKLLAHLHDVDMDPGGIVSGQKNTKGTGKKRFNDLTDMNHDDLLADWGRGGTTTSCNGFVGKCAQVMGYKGGIAMSQFEIADELAARGLGNVWVTADSGATPEPGDIFRLLADTVDHNGYRKNHMGVVLEVGKDGWLTAEGGQGGKKTGYDRVCKKRYAGPPEHLRGWVSIKALANAAAPTQDWIGGWWVIEEPPYYTWYYHFGPNGVVQGTSRPPASVYAGPANPEFVGTYKAKSLYVAQLSWNDADVDEELTVYWNGDTKRKLDLIKGKTMKGNPLTGERLMQRAKQKL